MKLYQAIQSIVLIDHVANKKQGIMEGTVKLYNRTKKKKKTHCNVDDLNKMDINGILHNALASTNQLTNEVCWKTAIKKEMVSMYSVEKYAVCEFKNMEIMSC